MTPLVTDPEAGASLEAAAFHEEDVLVEGYVDASLLQRMPQLQAWVHQVAAAAGLTVARVLPPSEDALDHRGGDELVAVVGAALFVTRDVSGPTWRRRFEDGRPSKVSRRPPSPPSAISRPPPRMFQLAGTGSALRSRSAPGSERCSSGQGRAG